MLSSNVEEATRLHPDAVAIREQLELLLRDQSFRTSKRSVQFLQYVVEKTLEGSADRIKERTIGVEVFGRDPAYDTNSDHIVRTAAIELRKRLAIYYGDETHRSQLTISLVPGSYVPQFIMAAAPTVSDEAESKPELTAMPLPEAALVVEGRSYAWLMATAVALLILAGLATYRWRATHTPQYLFWKPAVESSGSVLLAVGDVPHGPPTRPEQASADVPVIHRTASPAMPFSDAVTMARLSGILDSYGKKMVFRPEGMTSFSDLRESPVVLIGAFNNEWSLRMTKQLRFTWGLDQERHLIYIKDAKALDSRAWSWQTDQPADHHGAVSGPHLDDYALISRIWNSQTGKVVIVIGGLYTYGTEAAGELLADPQMFQTLARDLPLEDPRRNLQIVLRTTVTDGVPGPPQVVALSTEESH